jgi:hypothetical protein
MRADSATDTTTSFRGTVPVSVAGVVYRTRASSVKNSSRDCHPDFSIVALRCIHHRANDGDDKGEFIDGSGVPRREKNFREA